MKLKLRMVRVRKREAYQSVPSMVVGFDVARWDEENQRWRRVKANLTELAAVTFFRENNWGY